MSFKARVSYTADGNTSTFAINFNFIDSTHVKVFLDGVSTTAFSITGSNVVMNSNPSNGVVVLIKRETPTDARLVDFQDGSVLTESDLDKSADQNFFIAQEISDDSAGTMGLDNADNFDALSKRIVNVADPVNNNDAVNKGFISTNLPNINTVAGISTQVTNVANNLSAITTANSNSTNVNTVATNIASVNTVATNITKVVAVADDLAEAVSEVVTVADDLNEATSEIDTVATNIANVNTVGTDIANVNSVATNISNVNAVNSNASNINAVAGNETNINAVNTNATNINTVAGAITNVNNVGGSIANVNTVASNLAGVNSFAERYRIQAGVPSSSNDVGDLVFDTTAQKLKVFDGTSYQLAGSSVNGTSQRFKFTATASQTTFSGNDDDGNSLTYDPLFLDVYLNGVRLVNGSSNDFVATNGTSIVLNSGASASDILNVVSFGTFSLASFSATAITSDTLASARLPVVPITKGGTGLSSLTGNSGKALVVNSSENGFDLDNTSSAEVYGLEMYYNPSTINYTVTVQNVSGSNKYFINGVQQDTLELFEGNTYIFDWSSATSHPFRFSTTSDGTHGGGTEYTNGVTVDTSAYTTTIVVPSSAPTLYYYCQYHSGMGGQANTPVPANNSLQVTTTNQGVDSINSTQFDAFDDVLFSASGFTFSLNNNGRLIATV
tara:strand:+ start:2019 stop:4034 length:2016 start_codon:yes stop_codon:yes gene_type:complete